MLYCEAMTRMLGDPDSGLPQALDCEAKTYSERLFNRLVPFLTFGESRAPLLFAPPHISPMIHGESLWRISELTAVFNQWIRLKLQLSLSHNRYELWFPKESTPQDSYYLRGLVIPPDKDNAPRTIEYCVYPAVLEHEPRDTTEVEINDLSQSYKSFVRLREEERSKATVICPAKVLYATARI